MPQAAGIPPATKAEAAAWLARLHADDRTRADEEAFAAWLAARPENAVAFEAVTNTWDLTGALSADLVAEVPMPPVALRRRGFLVGLGTLVAAGAGLGVWQQAYAGVYETAVGEQRHVSLSDGTQVFLDTDTRIRERFTSKTRSVEFDRGRANFRVKPDARRPFTVLAAAEQILAGETTFDVGRAAGKVCVVLLHGHAVVLADGRAQPRRWTLATGERLVLTGTSARIDKPNLAPLTAWQTGQAIFDNETLSEAVAEMNRYTTLHIVVADPALRRLRISGVYGVGDNEAFARSISALLPVIVERAPDHLEFVPDISRMSEG